MHTTAEGKADRARRGSAAARGYDARWRKYRKAYLADPDHALCVFCKAKGIVTAADVIDHIKDHKGDQSLFWDPLNHRPLCRACHDRRVDAGDFGRKP